MVDNPEVPQKKNKRKATKWEFVFLYTRNGIGIIKGMLIIPLYLHFIDISLYGAWLATGNILAWMQIIDPGTGQVLKQKVGESYGANDKKDIGLMVATGFIISLFVAILIFLLSIGFSFAIPSLVKLSENQDYSVLVNSFLISSLGVSFTFLTYSLASVNRAFLRTKEAGMVMLVSNIIGLVVNVVSLYMGHGLMAIAMGNLVTGFFFFLGNFFLLSSTLRKERIIPRFEKSYFKKFFGLISYSFFSRIASMIVDKIDLLVISRFVSAEAVTMFELTRRPLNLMHNFSNRASTALMPALSNLKGEKNIAKFKEVYLRFANFNIWFSFLITILFIFINKDFIPTWTGKDLYIGFYINMLICVALMLKSLLYNTSNFTFSWGDIKGNSMINVVKSGLYLILLFVLVNFFGLYGVISAYILSILLTEAWYYPKKIKQFLLISNKEYMPFMIEFIKLSILTAGFSIASLYFNAEGWIEIILQASVISTLFLVILYLTTPSFKVELRGIIRKIKKRK